MTAVLAYLQIPNDYDGNRYSLSWSSGGEAIERPDGTTFALAEQLALFLEGYASVGPLIHFSYILYLLHRFDTRGLEPEEPGLPTIGFGRELVEKSDSLASAFRATGRPLRNAGALCAWLTREVPPVVSPPDPVDLCRRLSNGTLASELAVWRLGITHANSPGEIPPLTALDFEMRFLNELRRLDAVEIVCWLKHGRGSLPDPGPEVARAVVTLKPKTLEGTIAALAARDRLAGAVPMVAQLVAALTLPPRRLAHRALPSGGYADVATRGRPEQILPSQFAIDDIEFLRRFAENELLYFHREEPHAPTTEELVVLLDQGVRTWGKVRHALAASALALAKLAAARRLPILVGATSVPGQLLDPIQTDDDTLGRVWESSDLSSNPGLALEQILEGGTSGDRRRDVVVLTHPRSVTEPDFAAASLRAGAGTRVFSVSIDEPGQVQLREWRRGVSIKVGEFRVDFTPPRTAARKASTTSPGADPRGWRGEVEPIPFPFRFGITHRIEKPLFDFDHEGAWLLLSTYRGLLHAWKLDGSQAMILPRGMVNGEVLDQVEAIVGVAGGFVVAGRVGKSLVALHYDFATRTARPYVVGTRFSGEPLWFYARKWHTVVAQGADQLCAFDLLTHEIVFPSEIHESGSPLEPETSNHVSIEPGSPRSRALGVLKLAGSRNLPTPRLAIADEGTPEPDRDGFVRLDRRTGEVQLHRVYPAWEPFTPMSDGQPMLRDCWLETAQKRGDVLALVVSGPKRSTKIRLFHGLQGIPGFELTPPSDPPALVLSSDGGLMAVRKGERQIEVHDTTRSGQVVFATTKGKTHSDARVTLGRYGMLIHVGRHVSLIRWDRDRLGVSTVDEGSTRSEHDVVTWPLDRPATTSTPLPVHLRNQSHRFFACARGELTAVVDVFGQIALLDRSDQLLAMFLAFRSQVAAWTPDGTRFGTSQGPSPLIDGPVTPNAAQIIGQTLKAATDAAIVRIATQSTGNDLSSPD